MLNNDYFNVSGDGVFYTIQGEGISMGKPACFLRLCVCNLKCIWCDTRYAWDAKLPEFWNEKQKWSIEETKERIITAWTCTNKKVEKRLVITGGEPLLQKSSIETLIKLMPDWTVEIETNGTVMPSEYLLERCQFNCSPKLENSGNLRQARINENVLRAINKANSIFKFVVNNTNDLDEIENDFIKPLKLNIDKIIIMPQGKTSLEVSENAQKVVETVKVKGYRLLGRLHCDIWGAKRKV